MLSIGIVGLPNVGKSTLFNALTRSKQANAQNFPFCTIDPNIGVVEVPDERLEKLAKISQSKKIIPTAIQFVDIAGLVKGASEGQGLGNKFLSHIREVDAIVQVVRNFSDSNVIHVNNKIDPKNDAFTINLELILADMQTVSKKLENSKKSAKGIITKETKLMLEVLEKIFNCLEAGKFANGLEYNEDEIEIVKETIYLIEGKHSKNSILPSKGDIKDGLLKMILYSNLTDVKANNKKMKSCPVLLLSSSHLKGSISSLDTKKERDTYFEKNGFSSSQKAMIETVMTEAIKNKFTVKLQYSR